MPEFARFSRKIPDFAAGMAKSRKCRHFPNPALASSQIAHGYLVSPLATEQRARVAKLATGCAGASDKYEVLYTLV